MGPIRIFIHDWTGRRIGEIGNYLAASLDAGLSQNIAGSFDMNIGSPISYFLLDAIPHYDKKDLKLQVSIWRFQNRNPNNFAYKCIAAGPVQYVKENFSYNKIPSLSLSFNGPYWYLQSRVAENESKLGRTEKGLSFNDTKRNLIAASVIQATNRLEGNTYIRALPEKQGNATNTTYSENGGFKYVSDLVEDLATTEDRFDWKTDFSRAYQSDEHGLILGDFVSAQGYGYDLTNKVRFEFGGQYNNILEGERLTTIANKKNKATHVLANVQGKQYDIPYADQQDINENGVFEEVLTSDLRDTNMRLADVGIAVNGKKDAQQMITFKPVASHNNAYHIPIPFVDYDVGDRVSVAATYGGKKRLDGNIRVWDINVNWDENGKETATLGVYDQ